ncbi:sensor histidine kinase [Spirillospora sp. CA-294931]|uniref:sensor histidine kinase n=1 Tax=Spirillospora sp. CA-294931 TaxID=3240042 RepID=UPI003D8FC183
MSAPPAADEARVVRGGPPSVLPDVRVPARGGRWRLTRIYRTSAVVLTVLLVAAAAHCAAALVQNHHAREALVGHFVPATLQQMRISGALDRQERALHDYVLTGETRFRDEYRAAIADETTSAARARRLLTGVAGGRAVIADLDQVTERSARWRANFADPVAAEPGGRALAPAAEAGARDLSAATRASLGALRDALIRAHGRAAAELRERATITHWAIGSSLALVALVAVALALLIRRTVLAPVAGLSDRVRAVAHGEFAHPLDVRGPAEIVELAAIVDAMRRRILDEWRVSSEARVLLDQQTAELRRSNAELEQFAYVASHDLQEPLRKVASFCQMIERRYGDQLDERGRQYIEFAVDGAKRMQALINDLLGFSRVGRSSGPETEVELDAAADRALDNLSTLREETGAEVVVDDLPTVMGDRTQLVQLFQNLIGNAIKFRGDQPPRIRVTARRDGDVWEFACRDNGIGIEPHHADRVFLIFQRLHPRDEYDGTGIGLALCKKIVEYHGGRIWLQAAGDEDDPGTTILWTIPAIQEKDDD